MGRHQAPEAAAAQRAAGPRPEPSPGPPGSVRPAPPPPRPALTPADPAGPAAHLTRPAADLTRPANGASPPGPDPEATTVLTPVGATRADLWTGGPPAPLAAVLTPTAAAARGPSVPPPTAPAGAPPSALPGGAAPAAVPNGAVPRALPAGAPAGAVHQPGTEYSTGTFTRVLLTGLGGSVEPAPPEPAPLPPGPATARDRAVATTRRLAARVAALRGDERTALLAVAAVVGVVLLLLAVLVLVVRLAGGRGGDPAPAAAPTPAVTAAASAGATPSATPSPTGSPLPPSGGTFASRRSGLCLGAPQGRGDAGAQLVQRACGTDFGTGFLLVGTAQPGQYELVNAGASRCADVLNASTDNGAPVVQWDCNGGPNQTFQLRPLLDTAGTDTGYVQIVAAHSGKCLDVTGGATDDGAPVQQWDCRDPVAELDPAAGNQSWKFSPN